MDVREEIEGLVLAMAAMTDARRVVVAVCDILRDAGKTDGMLEGLIEVLGVERRRLDAEKAQNLMP